MLQKSTARVAGNFCAGVSRNYEELRASWQLRANNTQTPLTPPTNTRCTFVQPAGAASQTAKLDATHNTGPATSLWYYFGHVMELTRSTGIKRCILSRQIPLWYQQQRENKYLMEQTVHKPVPRSGLKSNASEYARSRDRFIM